MEKNGDYATVDLKSGASILPIDGEGFVYITKQFKYAIGRDSLEVLSEQSKTVKTL